MSSRRANIVTHHPSILRARRKRAHGTAKSLHGLARAVRRGLENMKIQALRTAMAKNLKKLVADMLLIRRLIENRPARTNLTSI